MLDSWPGSGIRFVGVVLIGRDRVAAMLADVDVATAVGVLHTRFTLLQLREFQSRCNCNKISTFTLGLEVKQKQPELKALVTWLWYCYGYFFGTGCSKCFWGTQCSTTTTLVSKQLERYNAFLLYTLASRHTNIANLYWTITLGITIY